MNTSLHSLHGEHFGDPRARESASHLGMWIFLASEVLLFSVMFTVYALYRQDYPAMFHEGPKHMAVGIGTANTFVLLVSSVFVALAVGAGRGGRRGSAAGLFACGVVLGIVFLVLKTVEYVQHVHEGALPGTSIYLSLYWLMTGVHALHVLVGTGVLISMAVLSLRGTSHHVLEIGGMYWHLVDVIWLFLWPLLYLV